MGGRRVSRVSDKTHKGILLKPSHFLFLRSDIQFSTSVVNIKFLFCTISLFLPLYTPLTSTIALLALSLTLSAKCFANESETASVGTGTVKFCFQIHALSSLL